MQRVRRSGDNPLDFDQMYRIVTPKVAPDDSIEEYERDPTALAVVPYVPTAKVVPRGTVMVTHARNKPFVLVKGSNGKQVRRRNSNYVPNSMPMLSAEPTIKHTFRYRRSDVGSLYNITLRDLTTMLVMGATNTTYRPVFRALRLLNVAVRGSIGAVGETSTVSIRYTGVGDFGNTNEQKYMDSTNKVDHNAMVHRKPPRMSLASFWHDPNDVSLGYTVFQVEYNGTGECYMDITIQAVLDLNVHVNFLLGSGTGIVPGRMYGGGPSNGAWETVGIAQIPGT